MNGNSRHKPFCFAGQPAPCRGYFPNDVLPCVCSKDKVLAALALVALAPAACDGAAMAAPRLVGSPDELVLPSASQD